MRLLTSNTKLAKCSDYGYLALGLQLLPGNKSGREVCPDRGACFATCLDTSGHGNWATVIEARRKRTRLWFDEPARFVDMLCGELAELQGKAERLGLRPAVRLNTFSDIPWEHALPAVFLDHPRIQWYDYTKSMIRTVRSLDAYPYDWPLNYDLTYSWNEDTSEVFCRTLTHLGGKIALVLRDGAELPEGIKSWQCVDGDAHDATFLYPPRSVLLLRPKGRLVKKGTVFA